MFSVVKCMSACQSQETAEGKFGKKRLCIYKYGLGCCTFINKIITKKIYFHMSEMCQLKMDFQWLAPDLTAFKMPFTKTFALKHNLNAVKLESVL